MGKLYGASRRGSIAAFAMVLALTTTQVIASPARQVCVLVPHFKDEYWLSVGYGLEQEALRQDISLLMFEAGGYGGRAQQIAQLGHCAQIGADAIVIGAVTSDHPDLLAAIADVAHEIPVYGLVNELHADHLAGWVGVDWFEMGRATGRYLAEAHPTGSPEQTAVFISGPAQAGWTAPLEAGLRAALTDSAVTISEVFGADTGLRQQLSRVEMAFERHPNADYVIGSAPAIEAAIGLFATMANTDTPRLVSTYISHTVLRGLMNGGIEAVSFDDPIAQGVMAMQMVAANFSSPQMPQHIGPAIILVTQQSEGLASVALSPADYFPALE